MTHGTARGPHVRLCGQFTVQPHVWYGILGTSSSHTFTTRAPHVWLCGEFTEQPHVRCGILGCRCYERLKQQEQDLKVSFASIEFPHGDTGDSCYSDLTEVAVYYESIKRKLKIRCILVSV
jgi:hypothetical protein